MKLRKLIVAVVVMAMAFAFAGCSSPSDPGNVGGNGDNGANGDDDDDYDYGNIGGGGGGGSNRNTILSIFPDGGNAFAPNAPPDAHLDFIIVGSGLSLAEGEYDILPIGSSGSGSRIIVGGNAITGSTAITGGYVEICSASNNTFIVDEDGVGSGTLRVVLTSYGRALLNTNTTYRRTLSLRSGAVGSGSPAREIELLFLANRLVVERQNIALRALPATFTVRQPNPTVLAPSGTPPQIPNVRFDIPFRDFYGWDRYDNVRITFQVTENLDTSNPPAIRLYEYGGTTDNYINTAVEELLGASHTVTVARTALANRSGISFRPSRDAAHSQRWNFVISQIEFSN